MHLRIRQLLDPLRADMTAVQQSAMASFLATFEPGPSPAKAERAAWSLKRGDDVTWGAKVEEALARRPLTSAQLAWALAGDCMCPNGQRVSALLALLEEQHVIRRVRAQSTASTRIVWHWYLASYSETAALDALETARQEKDPTCTYRY